MNSKIERGERKAKRSQIPFMAKLFEVEEKELLIIWLTDKVLDTVEDASEVKNDVIAYVQNEIEMDSGIFTNGGYTGKDMLPQSGYKPSFPLHLICQLLEN